MRLLFNKGSMTLLLCVMKGLLPVATRKAKRLPNCRKNPEKCKRLSREHPEVFLRWINCCCSDKRYLCLLLLQAKGGSGRQFQCKRALFTYLFKSQYRFNVMNVLLLKNEGQLIPPCLRFAKTTAASSNDNTGVTNNEAPEWN